MRLFNRGREKITLSGREMLCAVRPLSGALSARAYGEYVQDMLRILLPRDALIAPGTQLLLRDAPYVCVALRCYPGHLAADLRRCSR